MYIILLLMFMLKLSLVTPKNLALVIDTTVSMEEELSLLKKNIWLILNDPKTTTLIEKYVMVTFDGKDLRTLTSTNSSVFKNAVYSLSAQGGTECPENSMTALETALSLSQRDSYVFLFTDAFAKDKDRNDTIVNFCRTTNSKVNIMLSGECLPNSIKSEASIDVYYDVTGACSGTVFQLKSNHYHQVIRFINEMIKAEWTNIITHDYFTGNKQFVFPVGSFASDAVIVASGERLTVEILDESDLKPTVTTLLDTSNAKVFRISEPKNEYKVTVTSQGRSSVTFYSKSEYPFNYGFSSLLPRNLKETSKRPIPGRNNYIVIELSKDQNLSPEKVEIIGDAASKPMNLINKEGTNMYTAEYLFKPNTPFKLVITARDNTNFKEVALTSKLIEPQISETRNRWTQPYVEIIDQKITIVKYGTDITLACKVIGYPKPEIWWKSNITNILQSDAVLLEIPSTYISYVNIKNATLNETISCKSKNSEGEYHADMELHTKREYKLDILQAPSDESIEYGTEKTFYCTVDAYPKATITWYHNNTLIEFSDNIIDNKNGELLIQQMSLEDNGVYECVARNDVTTKRSKFTLTVSGLAAPKITLTSSNINVQRGDNIEIECSVTGTPQPTGTWQYRSDANGDFGDVPTDVQIENEKLVIKNATTTLSGTYRCKSYNILGEAFEDVLFEVYHIPVMSEMYPTELIVREGDDVNIPCKVDAIPKANVRWELTRDDTIVPFHKGHKTDEQNSHRFTALWRDFGTYRCVAENVLGKSEATINVIVHAAPYIELPVSREMAVKEGGTAELICKVFGYPQPTIRWDFIAASPSSNVVSRPKVSSNTITLNNVSKSHEGLYVCTATNELGVDSFKITLRVK